MNEPTNDLNFDVRFPARRKLIRFLVVLISLGILVFTAVEIENWRGRNAWKKFQREAEAKGETFDLRKLAPPEVPNESNFASVPIFAKLFDYYRDSSGKAIWRDAKAREENPFSVEIFGRDIESPGFGYWVVGRKIDLSEWQAYYQKLELDPNNRRAVSNAVNEFPVPDQPGHPAEDVLLALSRSDDALAQLREASARPFSRFPIDYDNLAPFLSLHLLRLKSASHFLNLRVSAELGAGQIQNAAGDIILSLRVANSLRGEPLLMSQLVRSELVTIALHSLWEGLDEHQWTDAQLESFQSELRQFDFLESQRLAMRGECAYTKLTTDMFRTNRAELTEITVGFSGAGSIIRDIKRKISSASYYMMPDGWFYQNQLIIARMLGTVLTSVDPMSRRVFHSEVEKVRMAVKELSQGFRPYKILAELLLPWLTRSATKFAFAQTTIDQAMLACALERYRLAHGNFPETLAELSPKFIEKIPHDIMNGEPLKYRRTDDGKFILYSIGWNETDDSGTVVLTSTGKSSRREEGDWVWQYPTNSSGAKQIDTKSEGLKSK